MNTPKNNQAGEPAGKDASVTPAHQATSNNPSAPDQKAGSDTRTQQPQAKQESAATADRQPKKQSTQQKDGSESGLEAKAKAWLNQQQWLQNVDVNQLSKQAKDLGSKAVEQVNRLTPTQKVVGGALLVSGLSWLALRSGSSNKGKANRSSGSDSASHEDDDTWQRSDESVYRGRKSHS